MSVKIEALELDGVTYTFVEADFFKAEAQGRKLLAFADGIIEVDLANVKRGTMPEVKVNAGAVLGNLGGEKFDELRAFILSNMRVVSDGVGVPFKNTDEQGKHFSKYRKHYAEILIAGLKFHFLDFLPDGLKYLETMMQQATSKAVAVAKEK